MILKGMMYALVASVSFLVGAALNSRHSCDQQHDDMKLAYSTKNIDGSLTCTYITHVRGLAYTKVTK